ncbi:MAG: aconitate hydratase AcnA [Candidatus Heimdallarchaeota archaeon]|nr:aconitate hydratase AcnA [Candidatus Heimdallarchaeota archaeon]
MELNEEIINNSRKEKNFGSGNVIYYDLTELERVGVNIDNLPYSIRILLENVLRSFDGEIITSDDVKNIAFWPKGSGSTEIPYMPARVLLQDYTGLPLIVDFADLRDAVKKHGGDPSKINPLIPTDLVVDHSIQIDYYGTKDALEKNMSLEFERNLERYKACKWAQESFNDMRIVPPGNGIVHQVNLEYLAQVVQTRSILSDEVIFPDTCVGTDSHTPMVNGVGVLGFGVGGIEAEMVMLGQPYYMILPEVVGVKLLNSLPEGTTATDLVLTVAELLRKNGVVEKFVEFFGPGMDTLTVPDRATISNMTPEYGATVTFFPVDEATCEYLILSGRNKEHVDVIRNYSKAQKLFKLKGSPDPIYSMTLELDLATIDSVVAGPANPEEKLPIGELKETISNLILNHENNRKPAILLNKGENGNSISLTDGDVVIAAITSCTNTSNPSVISGAGLLAKNAVEKGLGVKPYVKTSLAPGSKVVTGYLKELGLLEYLEALKFHTVGYGCTTCIGNSGPLDEIVTSEIIEKDLLVTSVLSGNRNFGGRVHALTRANFLASPMLVVAYAIAGTTKINLKEDPLGNDNDGNPVYLKDIWPSSHEIQDAISKSVSPELYKQEYGKILVGEKRWSDISAEGSTLYPWDQDSSYVQKPPYFDDYIPHQLKTDDIKGARVLINAGDKVSTDHISPAGSIAKDSPAGKYLISKGIDKDGFNTYGARRGNHEIMQRGTFANVRLRNKLAGREGGYTKHFPSNEIIPVWDAAEKYKKEGVPLIILGGNQYGQGSSRDWGAKGPKLQGVQAVIVKNFERIHRSNLIGMGILPLLFKNGEDADSLGLDGSELFDIVGLNNLRPNGTVSVKARKSDSSEIIFEVMVAMNSEIEIKYYQSDGILPFMANKFLAN